MIVYHYCSLESLNSILKNRSLRLTNILKSNDSMEISWICRYYDAEFKRAYENASDLFRSKISSERLMGYVKLFTDTALFNFPKWFLNTLFVAICSCILTTFFVLAISYCLSRLRFKIRKPYMNVAMILGMFPGFMSMIAVYYILKGFGLTKGPMIFLALIMVYSGSAGLGFYVSKGFFDTIPKALDEAAIVDGATKWDVFSKIIMPLSKPIIVSTIMTSFMAPWLDFIFAKVIAGADPRYYTVAIGLYTMLTKENIVNWYACFAAGAVCVSIPIAILFLYLQKYYAEGMSGAVKG